MRKTERTTGNECCGYKEKLAREIGRDRTKPKRKRKNSTKPVNGCCGNVGAGDDDIPADSDQSKPLSCLRLEKKSKIIKKVKKNCSCCNRVLNRIKPSFEDREKYTNLHILCILEEEDAVTFRKLKEFREKLKKEEEECREQEEAELKESKEKKKKKDHYCPCKEEKPKEPAEEPDEKEPGEEPSEEPSQEPGGSNKKPVKPKNKEKKEPEFPLHYPVRIECESICSIDSTVDVSDLLLNSSRSLSSVIHQYLSVLSLETSLPSREGISVNVTDCAIMTCYV